MDEEAEQRGDLIIALIGEIRREKAEKHLPLNTPVKKLTVFVADKITEEVVKSGRGDITGSHKVISLEIVSPREQEFIGGKKVLQDGREIPQFPVARFAAEYDEGMKK
jgi:valyl-tRNA synthetase